MLNRFSRLTSLGAKNNNKKKDQGERRIEKEPKVEAETDRDRCLERDWSWRNERVIG